jgi:hypothetical protein
MLDLNKYADDDKSKIFHTSGHARVGRGAQIGSAGTQSFQQRIETAQRERTIEGYQRSQVGSQRGALRARAVTPSQSPLRVKKTKSNRQQFNAGGGTTPPTQGFREPPSRGYNPYA